MKKTTILLLLVAFFVKQPHAQNNLHPLTSGKNVVIRSMTVLDDHNAWVGASKGWTAKTHDAGKTWDWIRIPGADSLDFRTLHAFDQHTVIVASAGTPLKIFKTQDSGQNWKLVYFDDRKEIFMDGVDFWENGRGLMYGDPIDGYLQLLTTRDQGETWVDISKNSNQRMVDGEAGFAASGTGIRTQADGKVWIGTGGVETRVLFSDDYGANWIQRHVPVLHGASSQGVFSLAVHPQKHKVWVVGGDYLVDTLKTNVGAIGDFTTNQWISMENGPFGYRSCIELIDSENEILIACGTSGVDITKDGGLHWEKISNEGFHIVRKARKGNWILLAGSNGKIAELKH